MKEFLFKINELIAESNIEYALVQIYNLLLVASSDLKNDAIILRGRLSKLKSDVRKGIITHSDEVLEFNKISNSVLGLVDDIQNNASEYEKYLADIDNSVTRADKSSLPELEESELRKNFFLSESQKTRLLQRMANIKERNLALKALWIDDNEPCLLSEQRLISALNVHIDCVHDSYAAEMALKNASYDFIISDLIRNGNTHAGHEFIVKMRSQNIIVPTILYITKLDITRGVPPFIFGITNRPTELLHLVMDIIERK